MNIKEEKKRLARLFRSRCYVCHKRFGKGFSFHHLWYSGEEPDYKDKKAYYAYVFQQIRDNPKQFRLVCKPHHFLIDRYLKRMADDKFRRVCKLRRDSR